MNSTKSTLIYGYGNPGRQDDSLANAMVDKIYDWIENQGIKNISCDSNYQLNVEDAEIISHFDRVIFIDASVEDIDDFIITKVDPSESHIEFTMHAVSCSFVLGLCNKMYGKNPETFLLHIKGYEWEFMEEMTKGALENLEKAFAFLTEFITKE